MTGAASAVGGGGEQTEQPTAAIFLAQAISDHLKNRLTIVFLYLELLEEELAQAHQPVRSEYLDHAQRALHALDRFATRLQRLQSEKAEDDAFIVELLSQRAARWLPVSRDDERKPPGASGAGVGKLT